MPSRASVVLADGQTTPVNHTFTPDFGDGENSHFQDLSAATPVGFWKYKLKFRKPSPKQPEPMYKMEFTIEVPQLAVTAPASGTGIQPGPIVAYVGKYIGTYLIPARAELAVRKDVYALSKNLTAHANVKAIVENCENYYG